MRDEVNKELKRLMDLAIDKENYEYIQDIYWKSSYDD